MSLGPDEVQGALASGEWRSVFDASALTQGAKAMRAKRVRDVSATLLDTGDIEITSQVIGANGVSFASAIAVWEENRSLVFEGDCSCGVGTNCEHNAATLEYLCKAKGERLAQAFGQKPQAAKMTQGQRLQLETETLPNKEALTFLLRVERRPENEKLAWLPEIYAQAYAVYEGIRVPLEPSGMLPPIVTPTSKIKRDRTEEMAGLQALYALDLRPGAEEPPMTLKKLTKPDHDGTLWAPDKQAWPHPEFYWQRFRHEGGPALERRRWEVRYAPNVGHKPLVFRTDTWRAEIVEEGRGWFSFSAGFKIDGESFELQPILAALVNNDFLKVTAGMPPGQEFMIFLPDGRGLALPVGRFRKILTLLGQLTQFKFTEGPLKVSKVDAARLSEEEDLQPEAPAEVKALVVDLAHFERIERVAVPNGVRATLREYQLEGYQWMQFLARHGLHGILADDMGLGKTLQTLTHILAEIEANRHDERPCLVVAPTSVVMNWQREAAKFAPDLSVLVLQGAQRKALFHKIPQSDLVLTSYALLPRDLEGFLQHTFHLLVLDEAQHVKNPGAQISQTVCQLEATHRLCLSGTPIENHLGELWSLMHFLMPGLLGTSQAFAETYRTPIEKNDSQSKRDALAQRIGPLILRRTKHDVAKELPPKTEIPHTIELTDSQKDLYETVRATMDKHVRQALELQGQQSQVVFLDALLKLRQLCCHPCLLEGQGTNVESSKFTYLVGLLETLREERHRVLLFSQFTSMLGIIEGHLQEVECAYLKLTGETKDRQSLVERFQGGEGEVFLISLKAGGTGLTLTGADTVIHYDPWWNPAAENQATDRAYRIGQDKPVFVHKLICKGTVEERIQQMQGRKDGLARDLLAGATQQLSLTAETLEQLFAPISEV